MNKTKRALQLTGAIISIVIGALTIISGIVLLTTIGDLVASAGVPEMAGALYAGVIIAMLFAVAMIVCGSLMCQNPIKKNTEYKGLTITMLVLNAFLLLCAFIGYTDATSIIEILLCMANVGFFISVLCIKGEPAQAQSVTEQIVEKQQPIVETAPSEPVVEKIENKSVGNKKIDVIRKLYEDGVISEDEMKTLIMKELEK